jgi:elongation factor Ts
MQSRSSGSQGDVDKAIEYLRRKVATAAKKQDGSPSKALSHPTFMGRKIGVLVEVNCETDFVAKPRIFKLRQEWP